MKASSGTRAVRIAKDLVTRYQITSPPVSVELIAKSEGLEIRYQVFEDPNWSGMLFRHGRTGIIAVNHSHLSTRQRFTIAHELGHYYLADPGAKVFVDTAVVRFRNEVSSMGMDDEEIVANRFAAELLMPSELLKRDVENLIDIESSIPELAERYKVSEQAMTIRLINLRLVHWDD